VKADKIFELVCMLRRMISENESGSLAVKLQSGDALEINYCLKKKPALRLITTPHRASRSDEAARPSRAK
jgi:hypothetical protein